MILQGTAKQQLQRVAERLLPYVKPWCSWSFPATLGSHSILYFQHFSMIAWINWKWVAKSNFLAGYESDIAFQLFSFRKPLAAWLPNMSLRFTMHEAKRSSGDKFHPSAELASKREKHFWLIQVKESSLTPRPGTVLLKHTSYNVNTNRYQQAQHKNWFTYLDFTARSELFP